jgi:TPR repeat protein
LVYPHLCCLSEASATRPGGTAGLLFILEAETVKKLRLLATASLLLVAFPQTALSKPSVLKIQPEGSQLFTMESGAQVVTSQMAGSTVVMRTPEPFDGKRTRIFFTFVNNSQFPVNVGPENVTSTQVAVISYDQLIAEQKRSEGVDKFIAALGAVGNTLSASDAGRETTVTSYSGYANCGYGCGGAFSGSAVSSTYSPYAAQQARAQAAAENAAAASEMHSGHASERNAIARNLRTTTVNSGHYITGMLTFELPSAVRRSKKATPITLAIRIGSDVHMLRGFAGPLGAPPPAVSSAATVQITQPMAVNTVPRNASANISDQGFAKAQYNLGLSYATGRGVAQHDGTAVDYFRKAADQGLADAQFYMGFMYANGRGVSQDQPAAAYWYRKAADQGNAGAQTNLGFMYESGLGVSQNNPSAAYWYRKAADQGMAAAQDNLGALYVNGRGVAQDYTTAVNYFRKASDQGYASAQTNLAAMYVNGQGVQQDYATAINYFRKAADQGYALAEYYLGVLYANGRGVPRDDAVAVNFYRKAAEKGHAKARSNLDAMYANGRGGGQKQPAPATPYAPATPAQFSATEFLNNLPKPKD